MQNKLSYVPKQKSFSDKERSFIDFVIDDQSLYDLMNLEQDNVVGVLGWGTNIAYDLEVLEELLLLRTSPIDSKRTILYGCLECGDIACGAITMIIDQTKDTFVWKNFGYENGYEAIQLEEFKAVGPFIFDKKEYYNTIEQIKNDVSRI